MDALVAVGALSTMICVKPRPDEAAAIADPDGDDPSTLHVTLCYLGEVDGDLGHVVEALGPVGATHAPLAGTVAGVGMFTATPSSDGLVPAILLPDVPGLVELRVAVTEALQRAGIDYSRTHGFQAHITLEYLDPAPDGEPVEHTPFRDDQAGAPLHFDEILVVRSDVEVVPVPLTGATPLTAAAGEPLVAALPVRRRGSVRVSASHHNAVVEASYRRAGELEPHLVEALEPILRDAGYRAARAFEQTVTDHFTAAVGDSPGWTPPAGDELLDVAALVAEIRARTDPVRRAFLEAAMTPSLEAAGLSFDVTNTLTAQALASSAKHIQSIADTTRLNVMRIVQESHAAGLSIPDTATAIRAGMADASVTRATMIARTELAGVSNGGSLAATRIVSDATGDVYDKVWMTAPGAAHPRHELVAGLDGQQRPLDDAFDVDGEPLMYPGDPGGSPENIIQCRCALSYLDRPGDGE